MPTWTVPELQAARYLALRLPQAVVAEKCFITDRQLRRWTQKPGFVVTEAGRRLGL